MTNHKTKKADVFAISLSGILPEELAERAYMVYAPLADSAMIVTADQWNKIVDVIDHGVTAEEEIMDSVDALCEVDHSVLEKSEVKHEHDFQNLTILPTNRCNFTCVFCYSAKGRSSIELDTEAAFKAIDFFIDGNSHDKLSLSILGGGEPLMSWNKTSEIIRYAKNKAQVYGKRLNISITTNGSLLNDEIIDFIKEYGIVTVVSYEILERIQNLHRGHYEKVKSNIRRMLKKGCRPQFNTVITPANVRLLPEIIRSAHTDFPEIKYICTDPVILPALYANVDELKVYHDDFIKGFFEARSIGKSLGVIVDCTASISMDCTIARYCPGEMGVTAHGLITLCPCVSSEKELYFNDFIYGKITQNGVEIDRNKLQDLLKQEGYAKTECTNCSMKYNCAGGCMYKNKMLSKEFKAETCRFMREFGCRFLFERLNDNMLSENGIDIVTILRNEFNQ